MTFQVEIIETLSIVKQVEAASPADAVEYVQALYRAGEIVLTADNANCDYRIKSL